MRDLIRRGHKVLAVAKVLVPKDTGQLERDLHVETFRRDGLPGVRVGSDLPNALWTHEGTGVHGPRGQVIRPRRVGRLVFVPKGGTRPVFAKSVRGKRGVPYLRRALRAARD